MATSIGSLALQVNANTGGLVTGMQKGSSSVKQFSKGVADSQPKLDSFTSKLKGMIGPLTALVGLGGAGAFFTKGILDAAQLEKDVISIKTLTGSIDIAKNMLAELQQFAAGTPFQMGDLVNATKQLLAFGVSASKIKDTLFVLGNVAAVSGRSVTEIASIFGKARAQGKLTTEVLNQFTERGIKIIPVLAKQFGVLETDIRGLVTSGKISFADLEKAFFNLAGAGGEMSGAMAEQSETLAGKWSTLQDNITLLGIEIAQTFIPVMKDLVDNAISVAQGLMSFVKVAKQIGESLSQASGGLVSMNSAMKLLRIAAFTAVIPAMIKVIKTLKNLAKAAMVAQASTGVGLVTALVSLAGALALEMGVDAIFGPIEEEAAAAGQEVGKLTKSLEELQTQGQIISKATVGPTEMDEAETGSAKIKAWADDADLSQLKGFEQTLLTTGKERAAEMQRLNKILVEQKRLGEDATLTAEEQEEIQRQINELLKNQKLDQESYNIVQDEIIEKEKEKLKLFQDQQKEAERLVESAKSQSEKYQDQLNKIQQLQDAGAFSDDPAENARLAQKARSKIVAEIHSDIDKIIEKQNQQEKQRLQAWEKAAENAGKAATQQVVRFGSKEHYERMAKANWKKQNPLHRFQKKSNEIQTNQLSTLRSIDTHLEESNDMQHSQNNGGAASNSQKPEEVPLGK